MYRSGGTRAICDRCGFEYRLSELRREWTGLMVCRKDYDPKPAQKRSIGAEGGAVRNARPDPAPIFRDPSDNGLDAL